MKKILIILLVLLMNNYSKKDIEIKHKGYNDLYYFVKYILGYDQLVYHVHKDLCDFIQNTNGDILDLEPRDHFKTTCISVGYPIFLLNSNPELAIVISHKNLGKAKDILSGIKQQYEKNPILKYYYGNQIGETWGATELTINRRQKIRNEKSISIGATDHEITSGHYDVVINDDLVGLKDMYSEAERNTTLRYYKSLVYIRNKANFVKEINIGTRWELNDLYSYIQKNREGINTRIKTAVLSNGEPYFPERYKKEELLRMQKEDPIMFSSQMMNNPMPLENQIFKFDNLKFYNPNEIKDFDLVNSYCDLAIKKTDSADFTSNITIGVKNGNYYVMNCWVNKQNPEIVSNVIIENAKEYSIRIQGIESNSFQELFVNMIEKEFQKQNIHTSIEKIQHSTDKQMRISSILGLVNNRVYFRSDWETVYPLLISQLINFPQGDHDDAPDSLEGCLSLFTKFSDIRIRQI